MSVDLSTGVIQCERRDTGERRDAGERGQDRGGGYRIPGYKNSFMAYLEEAVRRLKG